MIDDDSSLWLSCLYLKQIRISTKYTIMRGSLVSVSRSCRYSCLIPSTDPIPPSYHKHRNALVIITSFCMVFYVGAYMGFGPMQLLLEKDGAFSRACSVSAIGSHDATVQITSCDAQSRALETLKFITTTFAQVSIPIFVTILDHYGPFILHAVLSILGCCGISCILISSVMRFPELLYVAFGLIGSLAIASNLIMMESASLFSDESSRRRVIALLSCLTDVGAGFGYWVLWAMANANLSFHFVIGLYLLVGICTYTSATYLWRIMDTVKEESNHEPLDTHRLRLDLIHQLDEVDVPDSVHVMRIAHSHDTKNAADVSSYGASTLGTVDEGSSLLTHKNVKKDHRSTFIQQALSSPFIILTALYSFHDSRIAFVSTSCRDFLGSLGDDATGFRYLTVFSLTAPLSLLGLPLVDLLIEKRGYIFAIQMVNVFAITHGLVLTGTENLNVQVLGFVLFSVYRCMAYAILLNYLEVIAKKHVLGKLTGVISVVPAVTNLINIPLSAWALGPLRGDFFWPNFLYTVVTLLCVIGVVYLGHIS